MVRALFFSALFLLTVILMATTIGAERCTDAASFFLDKLQAGDSAALLTHFGDNSCHCQPRGGYLALLKYQSGENDNLAFLFGHKFKTGAMSEKAVPTIEKLKIYHLPWETPESVEIDIPVSFSRDVYSPYFLPIDTAYGHQVSKEELLEFCKNPAKDFWKALSLRLRPTLEPGLIPPTQKRKEPQFMADLFAELLPADQSRYLRPADPGTVLVAEGKTEPLSEFARALPRLKQGLLRVYMGRRGRYESWTVKKARLKDPVFELQDGKELSLTTPDSALVDIHGPALGPEGGSSTAAGSAEGAAAETDQTKPAAAGPARN